MRSAISRAATGPKKYAHFAPLLCVRVSERERKNQINSFFCNVTEISVKSVIQKSNFSFRL